MSSPTVYDIASAALLGHVQNRHGMLRSELDRTKRSGAAGTAVEAMHRMMSAMESRQLGDASELAAVLLTIPGPGSRSSTATTDAESAPRLPATAARQLLLERRLAKHGYAVQHLSPQSGTRDRNEPTPPGHSRHQSPHRATPSRAHAGHRSPSLASIIAPVSMTADGVSSSTNSSDDSPQHHRQHAHGRRRQHWAPTLTDYTSAAPSDGFRTPSNQVRSRGSNTPSMYSGAATPSIYAVSASRGHRSRSRTPRSRSPTKLGARPRGASASPAVDAMRAILRRSRDAASSRADTRLTSEYDGDGRGSDSSYNSPSETSSSSSSFHGEPSILEAPSYISSFGGKLRQHSTQRQRRPSPSTRNRRHSSMATDVSAWAPTSDAPSTTTSLTASRAPTATTSAVPSARPQPAAAGRSERVANVLARLAAAAAARDKEGATPHRASPGRGPALSPGRAADPSATTSTTSHSVGAWLEGVELNPQHTPTRRPDRPSPQCHTPQPRRQLVRSDTVNTWRSVPAQTATTYDRTTAGGSSGSDTTASSTGSSDEESRRGSRAPVSLGQASDLGLSLRDFAVESELSGARGRSRPSLLQLLAQQSRSESRPGGRDGVAGGGASGIPRDLASRVQRAQATLERLQLGQQILKGSQADEQPFNTQERRRQERKAEERRQREEHEMRLIRKDLGLSSGVHQATRGNRAPVGDAGGEDDADGSASSGYDEGSGAVLSELLSAVSADGAGRVRRGRVGSASTTTSTATATTTTAMPPALPGDRRGGRGLQGRARLASISEAVSASGYGGGSGDSEGPGSSDSSSDSDSPDKIVRRRLAPGQRARLIRSLQELHQERPELLESQTHMRRLRRLLRWLAGMDGAGQGGPDDNAEAQLRRLQEGSVRSGAAGAGGGGRAGPGRFRGATAASLMQAVGPSDSSGGSRDSSPPRRVGDVVGLGGGSASSSRSASPATRLQKQQSAQRRVRMAEQRASQSPGKGTLGGGMEGVVRGRGEAGSRGHGRGRGRRGVTSSDGSELLSSVVHSAARGRGSRGVGLEDDAGNGSRRSASKASRGRRPPRSGADLGEDSDERGARVGANMGRLAQAMGARRDNRRQGAARGSAGTAREGDSSEKSEQVATSEEGSEQVAVGCATRSRAVEKGRGREYEGTGTERGRQDARAERDLELDEACTEARPQNMAAGPRRTESSGLRAARGAGSAPTGVEGHSAFDALATSGPPAAPAPAPAGPPASLRSVDAQTSAIRNLKAQLLALEQQLLAGAGPEGEAGFGGGGGLESVGEGQAAELHKAAGSRGVERQVSAGSLSSEEDASLATSVRSTGAGARSSGSGLHGGKGRRGQVPAGERQGTGDGDGDVGREGSGRLGSSDAASALGERLGELRDAFAQRRVAKKDREGHAQQQQPLNTSGSMRGDVGLGRLASGGTAAEQGSQPAAAGVGGAGSPHEGDVHELPVLSSTDKGRVRTALPGQGLVGMAEGAAGGTPLPPARVLEPLMGEAAGPGTAGSSALGTGGEEGGFGSPVGGDGAAASGAQQALIGEPDSIAGTAAGAVAAAGAGGATAPGAAAPPLGAVAVMAQLEEGDRLGSGPSVVAGAGAGAAAGGCGGDVPTPGAATQLLAQLEEGGRRDGGPSAPAGLGAGTAGGVLATGATGQGYKTTASTGAGAAGGVLAPDSAVLLPAQLEESGRLGGGPSTAAGAGAVGVLAPGVAAGLLAQLEEDREALLDRCLELEEQLQARTQELQRRFAGGGAVVYGQGGGSGSFPGHASAAPGISAGVSSSSMTGLGQGQGQQAGVLHGGQQMEERAALAARCEDLQRQLATVHGEVDSLVGRTHTMQSAVADGASGLRGRLSDLEGRLAALEAENAALRHAAAGAGEMYDRAADLAAQLSLLQDHVDLLTLDKRELQVELELAQMTTAGSASGGGADSPHRQYLQEQLQAMSFHMVELLRDKAVLEQQARTLHQQIAAQEQQQQGGGKIAGPAAAATAALAPEQQTPATVARARPPGMGASRQGGLAVMEPRSGSGPPVKSSSAADTPIPVPQGTRGGTHHPATHFFQHPHQQLEQVQQQQHTSKAGGKGGGGVVAAERQSNRNHNQGQGGGGGGSGGVGGHGDGVPESEVRALFLGRIAQLQRRMRQLHAENDDLALQAKPSPKAAAGVSSLHGQVEELGQQLDVERRVRSHLNDLQVRAVGADASTQQATPTRRREADLRINDPGTMNRGPSLAPLVHQARATSAQRTSLEIHARVEALEQPATLPGPRATGGTAVHSSAVMPVMEVDVSVVPLVHSSAALQRRGQAQVQSGQPLQPGSARSASAQLWAAAQGSLREERGMRSRPGSSSKGARATTGTYEEGRGNRSSSRSSSGGGSGTGALESAPGT